MKVLAKFKTESKVMAQVYPWTVILDEDPEYIFIKDKNKNYIGISQNNIAVKQYSYSKHTYDKGFGGMGIKLKMKDGATETIKDDWWDAGYKEAESLYGELEDVIYYLKGRVQSYTIRHCVILKKELDKASLISSFEEAAKKFN